jgi:hypothetical protein
MIKRFSSPFAPAVGPQSPREYVGTDADELEYYARAMMRGYTFAQLKRYADHGLDAEAKRSLRLAFDPASVIRLTRLCAELAYDQDAGEGGGKRRSPRSTKIILAASGVYPGGDGFTVFMVDGHRYEYAGDGAVVRRIEAAARRTPGKALNLAKQKMTLTRGGAMGGGKQRSPAAGGAIRKIKAGEVKAGNVMGLPGDRARPTQWVRVDRVDDDGGRTVTLNFRDTDFDRDGVYFARRDELLKLRPSGTLPVDGGRWRATVFADQVKRIRQTMRTVK